MSTSDTSTYPPNDVPATPSEPAGAPSRSALAILIVTAFLNAVGIGLVSPVLPFIVQGYISDQRTLATTVGWLASIYAICQFLAAPGLGALSDRFGRRPILLICLLGSAIGYLLFGFGGALWMLFLLVGALDILMQGVLSGRLLKIFGESTLTIVGFVFAIATYVLMSAIVFVPAPALVYAGVVLFGISSGLIEPALRGLISQAAGPREQGVVQGSSQSIQSLAMVLGPLWGALLYTQLGHASSYWAGVIFGLGILTTLLAVPAIRADRPATDAA